MTDKHYSFRDGMPTRPDVQLLQKQWPSLQVGDRIPYDDVEAVIGIERGTARWKSITNSWRHREREMGRVIECEAGKAFYVATADQLSAMTYGALQHIGRSAKRHRNKLATVEQHDNVSDDIRSRCQHHGRLMWQIEKESSASRKNLLPDTRASQQQISPPKSKTA